MEHGRWKYLSFNPLGLAKKRLWSCLVNSWSQPFGFRKRDRLLFLGLLTLEFLLLLNLHIFLLIDSFQVRFIRGLCYRLIGSKLSWKSKHWRSFQCLLWISYLFKIKFKFNSSKNGQLNCLKTLRRHHQAWRTSWLMLPTSAFSKSRWSSSHKFGDGASKTHRSNALSISERSKIWQINYRVFSFYSNNANGLTDCKWV